MKKMLMLFAAGTVIGALALRPKCAETVVSTTAAAPAPVASMPDPVAIVSYATPEIAHADRNVFAFHTVSVEDRRSRLSPSTPTTPPPTDEGQARVPVLHREERPEARYLGAFGPQENPILVFKRDGDVVTVPLRKP
jgi:hypothetical protein